MVDNTILTKNVLSYLRLRARLSYERAHTIGIRLHTYEVRPPIDIVRD